MTAKEEILKATVAYVPNNTDATIKDIPVFLILKWFASVGVDEDFPKELFSEIYESSNYSPSLSRIDEQTLTAYMNSFYNLVNFEARTRGLPSSDFLPDDIKLFDFANYDKELIQLIETLNQKMDTLDEMQETQPKY